MNNKERIAMLESNLHFSRLRYNNGEISKEYYETLRKDVSKRIRELK